ncbi:carbamoyl phosphate synthase large subunit, partial [mine drainage metagenome]
MHESLQKALRGLEIGKNGLDPTELDLSLPDDQARLKRELREPSPERLFYVADAFRAGLVLQEIHTLTHIDPWFLAVIEDLVLEEARVREGGLKALDAVRLRALKRLGFADARLAAL